jgi:hypothetical protein
MAIVDIAKKMLGFADEFMEGASKGIGDAGSIKASVNKISSNKFSSNMTKAQKKKPDNIFEMDFIKNIKPDHLN